jgi:AbrB family looped-hinge helix DNA binding protein
MLSSTITTKGQITIPKDIRNILNIGKGDRVEFLVNANGLVTILPVTTDITALKGLVPKPEKYVSLDDMKNAIKDQGGRS